MHLKLKIDYKEFEAIVKQMPVADLMKLNTTINHQIRTKKQAKLTSIQSLLLQAPTWSDAQYNKYVEARQQFNKSRLA